MAADQHEYGRFLIISDSIFRDINLPGLAHVFTSVDAKVYTLFYEACKSIDWLQYSYTIIHCGTIDVGNGLGDDVVRGLQFTVNNILCHNAYCDRKP